MRIKNTFILGIVIALLFSFSACTNEEKINSEKTIINMKSDPVMYDSVEALYKRADLVIKGKVLESKVEVMSHLIEPAAEEEKTNPELYPGGTNAKEGEITTIYTIEVNDIYKGEIGKTINLLQAGGETDTTICIAEDVPEITIGSEYILFLNLSILHENSAWLSSNIQAIYPIKEGELTKLPDNKFDLTYEGLTTLQEASLSEQ